jgi:outer membrane protein assembly factor BamB
VAVGGSVAISSGPDIVAFDPVNGTERWRVTPEESFGVLTVADGSVAVLTEYSLLLLNPATGEEVRSILFTEGFASRAEMAQQGSMAAVYGTVDGKPTVTAVDVTSGETLWSMTPEFEIEELIFTKSALFAINSLEGIIGIEPTRGEAMWVRTWKDLDKNRYDFDSYGVTNENLVTVLGSPGIRMSARSATDGGPTWETGDIDQLVELSPSLNQFSELISLDSGIGVFLRNSKGTLDFVQFDTTGKETGRITTEVPATLDGAPAAAPTAIAAGENLLLAISNDVLTAWTITP